MLVKQLFAGDPELLAEERRVVVDHHDATVEREGAHHIVGHVPRVVRDDAAGRMRRDHRRLGRLDRIEERLVGHMRDVDHHAEPVHLADDILPERGEAVVGRFVGRGIGPVVVLVVREGHVPDAERGVDAQQPHVVVDHVATFHAHERGDLVIGRGLPHFGRRAGTRQPLQPRDRRRPASSSASRACRRRCSVPR